MFQGQKRGDQRGLQRSLPGQGWEDKKNKNVVTTKKEGEKKEAKGEER